MHPVVLLLAMAAYSARAWAAEGYTETLSSTASTLSALVKSGLSTLVGAIGGHAGRDADAAGQRGDHGVTRVGAARRAPGGPSRGQVGQAEECGRPAGHRGVAATAARRAVADGR